MKDIIKEAKDLCAAATPGPWEAGRAMCCPDMGWVDGPNGRVCGEYGPNRTHSIDAEDAEFIARARTLIPELVARLEAAEKVVEAARPYWPLCKSVAAYEALKK